MVFILDSRGPSEHRKDAEVIKKWLKHMAQTKGLKKTRTIEIAHPKVSRLISVHSDDC